jgi:hypothetical protein
LGIRDWGLEKRCGGQIELPGIEKRDWGLGIGDWKKDAGDSLNFRALKRGIGD